MHECVASLKKKFPKIKILSQRNVNFILDEIDWIKSCDFMKLEEYQNVDRLGCMSGTTEGPQRLLKNSDTHKIIFDLMKLYDDKLHTKGYIDGKTMSLLALEEAKRHVDKKYTHILVDESQDLTRVQIEFLRLIYNQKYYSSFCLIADTAQSIYPHSWLVKGRSFSSIGFNMKGKSNSLSKNYRTTTQIAESAYSLIEKDPNILEDENFVKPSLIDRKGDYPVYKKFMKVQEEAEYISNEIKTLLNDKYNYSDIAIIAKRSNQLIEMEEYLKKSFIKVAILDKKDPKFEEDTVKLLTMHSIKGLEFKVVFIYGLKEGVIPHVIRGELEDSDNYETSERKLLYVGMTRANDKLYLTNSGEPSKFIKQINHKFLRIKSKSKIKTMYDIEIDNYRFANKIVDLYSNEEKIRQWLISELVNTYGYPENLIEIEYKVQNFSQMGLVDIAISIYKNNIREPYIFVETKAFGQGIDVAINQLKSYMNVNDTCQYGIVTDGCMIVVLNKDYNIIPEIPKFHPSMMISGLETYKYKDLRHRQNYQLVRDQQNLDEISVNREGEDGNYETSYLTHLNVYGEIVAGLPKLAVEEIGARFAFPTEWIPSGKDCFLLKVVGDSMKGVDINYGDFVVVQKQNTATNMDIVVATVDENATLKKFMSMGDNVLLIPENPNYEVIQMNSGDVLINGVVIGILKVAK